MDKRIINFSKKRIAIVTGGASGIGWATAKALNKKGINVIVCDNSKSNIEIANQKITKLKNKNINIWNIDVTSEIQIKELFIFIKKEFGHLNYLVNNAGIDSFCDLSKFSLSKFNQVMMVNTTSVFMMTSKFLPLLRKRKNSVIVNIGSIHGHQTTSGRSDYVTSKTALIGATRSLALDLAQFGIRVNMVSPGAIETEMLERGWRKKISENKSDNYDYEKIKLKANLLHPVGRIGKPKDIARAILFLLSKKSKFINGVNLIVDGGIHSKTILSNIWEK